MSPEPIRDYVGEALARSANGKAATFDTNNGDGRASIFRALTNEGRLAAAGVSAECPRNLFDTRSPALRTWSCPRCVDDRRRLAIPWGWSSQDRRVRLDGNAIQSTALIVPFAVMTLFPQARRAHAVARIAEHIARAPFRSVSLTPLAVSTGVTVTRDLHPATDHDGPMT
jgi:hypothetical protein